jgi:hypothetical protein
MSKRYEENQERLKRPTAPPLSPPLPTVDYESMQERLKELVRRTTPRDRP